MFMKTKTVDSILSSFKTMAADLEALMTTKGVALDEIAIKQKELDDEKDEVTQEMVKAQAALDKINNFLGG